MMWALGRILCGKSIVEIQVFTLLPINRKIQLSGLTCYMSKTFTSVGGKCKLEMELELTSGVIAGVVILL
jgi:hypothetical protein